MPSVSDKQHRAMESAAHGHSTLGIPKSVGQEFVAADCQSLSQIRKDMEAYYATRSDAEFNEADHPRDEDGKFGSGGGLSGYSMENADKLFMAGNRSEASAMIKNSADEFAKKLKEAGFSNIRVEHSGSKAGPSSYVNVSGIDRPFRFSNHSKGAKEFANVISISERGKAEEIINTLIEDKKKKESSPEFAAWKLQNEQQMGASITAQSERDAKQAEKWKKTFESIARKKASGESLNSGERYAIENKTKLKEEFGIYADSTGDLRGAAGILFRNNGQFLLVKRADNGAWEQPGGHIKSEETPQEAAIRECMEEIGSCPYGVQYLLSISPKNGGGSYSTYLQDSELFEIKLNPENVEWGWFSFETLPIETHPHTAELIRTLSGTELDIAKGIQTELLTSPQHYENIWLFDVRITGTGTSYREAHQEYVYRVPENFLTDDFLQRCNGLPLIFEHPEKSIILNGKEFKERAIGNVVLPYIKNDEVRGVAKVYDDDDAVLMQNTHTSTSPAVVFRRAGSTETIMLGDGKSVLIEGVPSYLDHLAICSQGVWDKGGEPIGINLTGDSIMAEEEKVPAWADSLVKKVGDACARMDSIEDSMKADKSRKDSEKTEEELKADKARKDSEESEAKKIAAEAKELEKGEKKEEGKDKEIEKEAKKIEQEKADAAARKDSEQAALIASMQAQLSVLTQPLSAADRDQLSAAQSRADSVAQMYGDSAAAPLHGESPIAYRRRLASKFQKHSKEFADIKLDALDGPVFDQVEGKIYADAQSHAMSPAVAVAGRLIPHVRQDSAGRSITTYTGDMDAWLGMFKAKPVYITGINTRTQGAN